MKLPIPGPRYDETRENLRNNMLEQSDKQNIKRYENIEIRDPQLLVLVSPNGSRWKVTVSNTGTLSATAI